MIRLENISKSFFQGESKIQILQNLHLKVQSGEKIAIIGPSGSGKSTLLSIMAAMDKPDEGKVFLDGEEIVHLPEAELCEIRNKKIGIVFQSFELINSFTALENVLLPLDIGHKNHKDALGKVKSLLAELGLEKRFDHLPTMLSGGEQQRVAIARAMIADSNIIFADEPTGNLDLHTGEKVMELLLRQVDKSQKTLVLITHDLSLTPKMDKVYLLKDGQLHENNH